MTNFLPHSFPHYAIQCSVRLSHRKVLVNLRATNDEEARAVFAAWEKRAASWSPSSKEKGVPDCHGDYPEEIRRYSEYRDGYVVVKP